MWMQRISVGWGGTAAILVGRCEPRLGDLRRARMNHAFRAVAPHRDPGLHRPTLH
jgi:hypothetical protein